MANKFSSLQWKINFGQIMSNKAQKMIDYKLASKSEIFTLFEDAYQTDPLSFDDPKPLYSYFKTYFELYKDGGNDITLNQIFNKYESSLKGTIPSLMIIRNKLILL